jgi:hypothetical protein
MDSLINSKIVIDTIEYIKRTDVLEFYSDIASKQASQFTILTYVLAGVTVALLGATWYWNHKAAKTQISEEIEASKNTLEEYINGVLEEKIKKNSSELENKISELLASSEKKLNKNNADVYRLFAIQCSNINSHLAAANWWCSALEMYSKANSDKLVGISSNAILKSLENNNGKKDSDVSIEKMINLVNEFIPECKSDTKKQILTELEKLK